jgi:parallel beta-helix repeat protein
MFAVSILKSLGLNRKTPGRRAASATGRRLTLEPLEVRTVPATLVVGGSGSFSTIQAALAAANNGDTVLVNAGTYTVSDAAGALNLTKSNLKLVSAGDHDGDADDPLVKISATSLSNNSIIKVIGSNDLIQGFTIDGGGNQSQSIDAAISVVGGGSASIKNNIIQNLFNANIPALNDRVGTGVRVGDPVAGAGTAKITNNVIAGYHKAGVIVDGNGSSATISSDTITGVGPTTDVIQYGVVVKNSASARITSNTITSNIYQNPGGFVEGGGIIVAGSFAKTAINNNCITANQAGVFLDGQDGVDGGANIGVQNVQVFNNDVSNNTGDGILLLNANSNNIGHNEVTSNGNGGGAALPYNGQANGITLFDSVSNQIIDNDSEHNTLDGIYIDNTNVGAAASNNTVQDNQMDCNGQNGLELNNSSANNLVDNDIAGNGLDGILITGGGYNLIHRTSSTSNCQDGIELVNTNNNTIETSAIINNGRYGISLKNSMNTLIRFNVIIDATAIHFFDSASQQSTTMYGNVTFNTYFDHHDVRGGSNVSSDDAHSGCDGDAFFANLC